MIVSYKNREAEVDIVCGAGNSALQIVFENSVQMNKVSTYIPYIFKNIST